MSACCRVARLEVLALVAVLVVAWIPPARGQDDDQVVPLAPVDVNAPWPLTPPAPKTVGRPPYPEAARRAQEQGTVNLLIKVLRDGTVGDITVKKSSGSQMLDEAAVAEAKHWQFVPGHRGPKAVETIVEVPVNFRLVE
jgi:periplasmic protein TonB